MGFSKKIKTYFKDKNLTIRKVSEIMDGYSENMISKFTTSDVISSVFITKLVKYFPDIDIKYLVDDNQEEQVTVNEDQELYKHRSEIIIEEIETRLLELKKIMSRK